MSRCLRIPNGTLTVGGPDHVIEARGRRWVFEMNDFLGPVVLDSKGNEARTQPRFVLTAIGLWEQQGKRVEAGVCVWSEPVQRPPAAQAFLRARVPRLRAVLLRAPPGGERGRKCCWEGCDLRDDGPVPLRSDNKTGLCPTHAAIAKRNEARR